MMLGHNYALVNLNKARSNLNRSDQRYQRTGQGEEITYHNNKQTIIIHSLTQSILSQEQPPASHYLYRQNILESRSRYRVELFVEFIFIILHNYRLPGFPLLLFLLFTVVEYLFL